MNVTSENWPIVTHKSVVRSQVVPVELIMGQCWVLDVNTYCKGRPAGVPEQHVYVCEYRVDKSAHLFTRIAKPRYPVCTKSYAFDSFDVRVKPVRTYTVSWGFGAAVSSFFIVWL